MYIFSCDLYGYNVVGKDCPVSRALNALTKGPPNICLLICDNSLINVSLLVYTSQSNRSPISYPGSASIIRPGNSLARCSSVPFL